MPFTLTPDQIRGSIDHAILKPEFTRAEVAEQLDQAARYRLFSVCVRPCDVAYAVRDLAGEVLVGTVIGFPHGTTSTAAKVAEARQAIEDGAGEIDMVLNISWLRSGLDDLVTADIAAVVEASAGRVVKVIFETALLNEDEIVRACHASEAAGATFVKTSTGFAGGGATPEHIALMRGNVGAGVEVKASGGVRSLDALLALAEVGATRFGTSASAAILDEAEARAAGAEPTGLADDSSY